MIADEFKLPASLIVNGLFWVRSTSFSRLTGKGPYWKNITVVNALKLRLILVRISSALRA